MDKKERYIAYFEIEIDPDDPRFWEIMKLIQQLTDLYDDELECEFEDQPFLSELEREIMTDFYSKKE